MRKVLIISYNYPPIGGVGIIRTLKFTKYLAKFGWMPYMLTVKNRDKFYTSEGMEKIPSFVKTYRSFNILNNLSIIEGGLRKLKIKLKIFVPDVYIGWIYLAIKKGLKIIEEEKIDLIYVSCPPHSSSIIGAQLKEKTGLPLVVDFRDAWTLNPYRNDYVTDYVQNIDEKLENNVMKSADYIVTATEGIASDYINKYPHIKSKIESIKNGFDMDDVPEKVTPFDKFTISYVGSFYGARTPDKLFSALNVILNENIIPSEDIQFLWFGRNAPFVHDMAKKYDLQEIFHYGGFLSKAEADSILYKSNLLFLIIGQTESMDENSTLTGKIFPYLASGTSILAMVPNNDAKKLIELYSDNSYIVTSYKTDDIVNAILNEYKKWKRNDLEIQIGEKTKKFRKEYNYETQTKRLAAIFDKTIHEYQKEE